jgi:transcriptional regulator with XRE-family HTH domain
VAVLSGEEQVEDDLKRIAARIRSWRDEAGLTLQQLGDKSSVSASTIHKIENLQTVPTIAVLLKVANGLNRRPSELLSEVDVGRQVTVMRRDDRNSLSMKDKGTVEHLVGMIPRNKLDVWRVRIEPGVGAGMPAPSPGSFTGRW